MNIQESLDYGKTLSPEEKQKAAFTISMEDWEKLIAHCEALGAAVADLSLRLHYGGVMITTAPGASVKRIERDAHGRITRIVEEK